MNRVTLNIGLWAGYRRGSHIDPDDVLNWLQQRFQWTGAYRVVKHQVTGEPTLVVFIYGTTHKSLGSIADDFCRAFSQHAFAAWSVEEGGVLLGPFSAEFGDFDEDMFIHMEGFLRDEC